jgi:hypothetical protein
MRDEKKLLGLLLPSFLSHGTQIEANAARLQREQGQ